MDVASAKRESRFRWEFEGRLPILHGGRRRELSNEESVAARAMVDQCGILLFRDFDLSGEQFVRWTEQLSGSGGMTRLAPGASALSGPAIGLHTEDAMLQAIPAWIWFYSVKPSNTGGQTTLCDGAAVVSRLSISARALLEADILYWWRASTPSRRRDNQTFTDPPGTERNYRGPAVATGSDSIDITASCRPLIRTRVSRRLAFGNHILNTLDHDDNGGPPVVDGFHRTRTMERKPLPSDLIAELQAITCELSFHLLLDTQDVLWVDNTRFLHGRQAFEGERYIVVRKSYHPDQHGRSDVQ